jgi:hypothetical protein
MVFFLQITLHCFHSVAADSIRLIRHFKLSVTLRYVTLRWFLHQPSVDLFSCTEFETDPEFLHVSYSSSFYFHSLSLCSPFTTSLPHSLSSVLLSAIPCLPQGIYQWQVRPWGTQRGTQSQRRSRTKFVKQRSTANLPNPSRTAKKRHVL